MMKHINISKKKIFEGKIHAFSSEFGEKESIKNLLKDTGFWSSERRSAAIHEFFTIDYEEAVSINFIELLPSSSGASCFPGDFRFETSLDGKTWKVIHSEMKFELDGKSYRLDIPLTGLRYLKVVITEPANRNSKYYSEIGRCLTGITGISKITPSSSLPGEGGVGNLFDGDNKTFWGSSRSPNNKMESLLVDLGQVYHFSRIILGSAGDGFPENFHVDSSVDNSLWTTIFEEKSFSAEFFKDYYWDINVIPVRYIRIEAKGKKLFSGDFAVQISRLEIDAAPFDPSHTHNIGEMTPHASIFQPGVVKLAKDGDDTSGTVVQGSDIRLRDASTIFKGITRLAEIGEVCDGVAVQASDSRLKPATDQHAGVVRLAYDREDQPGVAVQGNDSRMQEATSESYGIVKLCPDGLYTDQGVVTGNDSRVRKATDKSYGICRLAGDGDNSPGSVVQADDCRLRDATTLHKGIVMLAEDGEVSEGKSVQSNDKRLGEATTVSKGIVELAEDGESKAGVVVQGNDRRLKDATTQSRGIVELADDGEDRPGVAVQGNDRRLRDATTSTKGIVELAGNGEGKAGVVVQGNDKRLRNATENFPGIMKFATDGSTDRLAAVQGNDRRLKDATTVTKGIVELAENGEDKEGVAVQGNDRRLNEATTESKGIVELAGDGEEKKGVVVQGHDRRLKDATESGRGIMRFAEDGEVSVFAAVQGNDKRLRDATVTAKGIVKLAGDGEEKEGVAVQGHDRRLQKATTVTNGIVELAENGESKEGVAVQGNDRRLKQATENIPGIVKMAKQDETRPGYVIQANDERLSDPRQALPHSHEYAAIDHEMNSHRGTLSIKSEKNEVFNDITPPSDSSSVIHGQNTSAEDGSIGISGVAGILSEKGIQSYGVVGHSGYVGVRGQSSGDGDRKGCGILGISRFGAGGVFSSEHSFSLVADGQGRISEYDDSINIIGNGDALYVNGRSLFRGSIELENSESEGSPGNIVELFEVNETEYISPGDLLVISEEGNSVLVRSRKEYNRSVIGTVAGNALIAINNSGKEEKVYPVTLAGKAMCKVDARNNPVNPGDFIVTSETPGCGMAGTIDSFDKIGTVIGKALDKLDDGIGVIPVFITHQ